MQTTVTAGTMLAMFGTMFVLACIPGVSAITVALRSAACGFSHGLLASLGIVTGDVVFIVIAIYGLALLADWLGGQFMLVRLLGGAYLVWLGIVLLRAKMQVDGPDPESGSSLMSSFLAGLFITLGDQKAILFYLGFFPAFVDLSAVTPVDSALIIGVAAVSVGGAKLAYAYLGDRARRLLRHASVYRALNALAGLTLIGVGITLITRV